MENIIQNVAVYAIPVLFAITLHEAAHGYVARMFGDHTAAMLGRITLNPLKHIDLFGTIILPLLFVLMAKLGGPSFLFGYAKPVPVNFSNLRNPKRDMIWVAGAGPASNLIQAVFWALFYKVVKLAGLDEEFFLRVAQAGVFVNIGLMALNLLFIPPLDGGRILVGLLPHRASLWLASMEPYGMWVIIGLLVLQNYGVPLLQLFLSPFYEFGFAIINLIV